MKNKINIFSDKKINLFLTELFSEYELFFMNHYEVENKLNDTCANIILLKEIESTKFINFKKLSDNFLIISNLKNINLTTNCKIIKSPTPINYIKTAVENFLENIKIQFHDITIVNEKLTNIKNHYYCYLTKLESEILSHLIIEKESTKKYVKENILNIKSSIQTNSLDSHLTRIRKKMNRINTSVRIQSKNEKLLIVV